jgi:hypothetical protein
MPTPVAEKYVSCVGSVFNIGGTYTAPTLPTTPASVSGGTNLVVMTGGYKRQYDVKPMTNNTSGGCYEDVKTIKKVTGSFKCAYETGSVPIFNEGDIYNVIIFNPVTTAVFQGAVRFNNVDDPILNVEDGLVFNFDITSQGTYTIVN